MGMALTLGARESSPASVDLQVYRGLQKRTASREDSELMVILRDRLATEEIEPSRLGALCEWAREFAPDHCATYVGLLEDAMNLSRGNRHDLQKDGVSV